MCLSGIKRVARELKALCEAVAPDARGRMTELAVRHLNAALEIGTQDS